MIVDDKIEPLSIRVDKINFNKAPLFRGGITIPANAVEILKEPRNIFARLEFEFSNKDIAAQRGDAIITRTKKGLKKDVIVIEAKEFAERFELYNKHYRERRLVRAFFICASAEDSGYLSKERSSIIVRLPGGAQLHAGGYLSFNQYGIYYGTNIKGHYDRWDLTGQITSYYKSRFEKDFIRTNESGKTIPMSESHEKQRTLATIRKWLAHEQSIAARMQFNPLSTTIARNTNEILAPNPFFCEGP